MIAHGSARITRDLDICYATDQANLDVLGAALVELGARLRGVPTTSRSCPDGRTLRQTTILTAGDRRRLDRSARGAIGRPPYAQLRDRADRVTFGDMAVLVASLDDLEAMKRAAGRPRDLARRGGDRGDPPPQAPERGA